MVWVESPVSVWSTNEESVELWRESIDIHVLQLCEVGNVEISRVENVAIVDDMSGSLGVDFLVRGMVVQVLMLSGLGVNRGQDKCDLKLAAS